MGKLPWFSHNLIQQVVNRPQNSVWCREWWGGLRAENGTVTSMQEVGKMGKGACSWDEPPFIFTVVSYILPIYCSALQRSCQRKEGLRIKKRTAREKQAEDTHGKPDQSLSRLVLCPGSTRCQTCKRAERSGSHWAANESYGFSQQAHTSWDSQQEFLLHGLYREWFFPLLSP